MKQVFVLYLFIIKFVLCYSSRIVRPLGGYERLLSRTVKGTNNLSLSHGCVYILNKQYKQDELLPALAKVIDKHEILSAKIVNSDHNNEPLPKWATDLSSLELAKVALTTKVGLQHQLLL